MKHPKWFWPKISSNFKHTEFLIYITNQAKNKQNSIAASQLDLRNVFGEVHHRENKYMN